MSYITKSMTIIITLCSSICYGKSINDYSENYSRILKLKKQGEIQGNVIYFKNQSLSPVEVYKGIPYASPPINELRFMPPSNAPSWNKVRYMMEFKPVCPQKFPDEAKMTTQRRTQVHKLKKFLQDQNEDCLYLNIYAPVRDPYVRTRSYPVIVFLHGESFEWNSGNSYDGSVLASYGQVIVITLNFRLGILGFLKVEPGEKTSQANFGLEDQVAALIWIKSNIDVFGGNPENITLLGHGTGAVFANLLTLSPMVALDGSNETLFQRAILMSGSALSDWALVHNPNAVTSKVAQNLQCNFPDNFTTCLRTKTVDELIAAAPEAELYKINFGPVVDNVNVLNQTLLSENSIFKKFGLIYGVTEIESINLPLGGDVALIHGMLEKQRDNELQKYMSIKCPINSEACFSLTRATYNYDLRMEDNWTSSKPLDNFILARNELLDILSDARTVAPIIQMGLYHSAISFSSYFYVFSHKTQPDLITNKTYTGEELPYVFGVPIESGINPFEEDISYTEQEKRLSMTIMKHFCNFAYSGNPEIPKTDYSQMDYAKWMSFDEEWIECDKENQHYLKFDIPISKGNFYREQQTNYWNKVFPNILKKEAYNNNNNNNNKVSWKKFSPSTEKLQHFNRSMKVVEDLGRRYSEEKVYGKVFFAPNNVPPGSEEIKQTSASLGVIIMVILIFVLANLSIIIFLYFKCLKNKKDSPASTLEGSPPAEENTVVDDLCNKENKSLLTSCKIVGFFRASRKKCKKNCDDAHIEANNTSKISLTRAMSNSTIDAHAKVRDWITHDTIYKYSPKEVEHASVKKDNHKSKRKEKENHIIVPCFELESYREKCPTRPVSPTDNVPNIARPLLIKTASIDRSNRRKRAEKISVAIDATPSGRGPSVLMQRPIEFSKSLDNPKISPSPLRRSVTMEDFTDRNEDDKFQISKSSTNINLKQHNNIEIIETEPTVMKITHGHSKSDPVQNLDYNAIKRLRTFDPRLNINVTSREDNLETPPLLTPEEALMTIKRRNFPKVLPDHPGRQAFLSKRRSMPVHNLCIPSSSFDNSFKYSTSEPYSPTGRNYTKFPPAPPPRTCTLDRQGSNPQPVCLSEPMLAEEPTSSPEPEVSCNNLYVGPLIPKNKDVGKDSIRGETHRAIPRAIITTNPKHPIKRSDPKVIVKPTINKNKSIENNIKQIPRVLASDNRPELHPLSCGIMEGKNEHLDKGNNDSNNKAAKVKKSQIPTLVKSSNSSLNKENSSSDSNNSPSSCDSDTGTVVKKV